MKTIAIPSSACRQQGATSVAIAMLLVFILVAAVTASMNMNSSSVIDSASSEAQTAALFLAESGVERAQATISSAAQGGSYTNTTCTDLASLPSQSLGRGTFQYVSAACLDTDPSTCTKCAVTVKGTVGTSSRTVRTQLSETSTDGVEGHGTTFTLNLKPTVDNTAVITNLAYRAKDGGGSNASVTTCTTGSSGSISACTNGWDLVGTGTNNVSGMGVYASVPVAGTYSITDTLSAARNYVQTGALFYPAAGASVSLVGIYATTTGSHKTTGTSSTSSDVPSDWYCALSSGTATASRAAGADTLVYGFSSWPASSSNQLNGVSFGSIPLRRKLNMTGTQGDYLYSQMWYTYNAPYFPGAAATASNGATFTGTLGANFKGHTVTNSSNSDCPTGSTCLLLDQSVGTTQILSTGDTVVGGGCNNSSIICTLGTLKTGTSGQSNALYTLTYTGSTAPNINNNTSLISRSNVLNVVSITAGTTLTTGDAITNTGETTTYGYLPTVSSGTTPATYTLFDASGNPAAKTQVASSTFYSSGTTITLTGTLSGSYTTPGIGTAVEIPTTANNSPGSFSTTTITGSIAGTTLNVTAVNAGSLKVGDALFSANVQPQTRITALGTGSGGTGTYTVTPSQTTASSAIVAKTAVVSGTASSFTVSRAPTNHISGVSICGGLCALMYPVSSSAVAFNLSNLTTGDDWASGFACLSGVDPINIKTLGSIVAKRTVWSEPVQ